jgi:hypothetical protein
MEKVKISQDTLYEFMLNHNVKMTRLAELIGKSDDVVTSCFKHHKDGRGKPRYFSAANVNAINKALPVIADELRKRLQTFGSEQKYTNSWGATYDPALIAQFVELGKYMNITGLVGRILGWTKGKKNAVLCQPSSKAYGNISEADVIAINNEILAVAGVLSSYELVSESSSSDSDSSR